MRDRRRALLIDTGLMSQRVPDQDGLPLPRVPASLLRHLVPDAERRELLADLRAEYGERVREHGMMAARRWLWTQVLASTPSLMKLGWWRGWTGFEPRANKHRPGGAMFQGLAQDFRYALRRLRMRPTYTLLTVLTLSLGVAGVAAAYSIVQRLLVEPLPVNAEKEIVVFWAEGSWSQAEFLHLRPEIQGFAALATFRERDVAMQTDDGPARLVRGTASSAELFDVLGVRPALGAGFQPGDDQMGTDPVVVISHDLWRTLGSGSAVLGQRIELGGVDRTITGVMPEGFWFPDPTVQVWLAEELNPEDESGNWGLIGRIAPGATAVALQGELARLMAFMHERFDYPEGEWDKRANPELIPLRERLVGAARPALLATLAVMAVILLIACVNVAALMLGQMDSRGSELAVRSALGAERNRLLQQVVVESLVVGLMAGLVGAMLAMLGFRFLIAALPLGALAANATVDWTLFQAAIVAAILAATLVALAPATSVARSDLQRRLSRSRTSGIGGRGRGLENGLVVIQVALVLLMTAGAGLLIRSVGNLRAIDPGIARSEVAVIDIVMPTSTEPALRPQVTGQLVEALQSLPGVEAVAATQHLPLRGSSDNWGMLIEARPELVDLNTAFRVVTPDYFDALGIQVVSGRGLLATDRQSGLEEGTVVINQALADQFFPDVDPVGQRIGFMDRWDRIVGVVNNVAEAELSPSPVPARYMVYEQVPWLLTGQTLVVRVGAGRDPVAVLDAARRTIQAAAPAVAIRDLTTLERVFVRSMGPAPQVMSLLTLLGGLALALGLIGVYGVVSHFVTRRRRDWAIRMALGMRPMRVVGRIVRGGASLVAAGVVLGVFAFLMLSRVLASFLYGVGTADAVSLLAASALLLGAGMLAAYIPARRASRIDPALILREQ